MEKRRSNRSKTDDDVMVSINGVAARGRMLNLSREGCKITGTRVNAEVGEAVTVTLLEGVAVEGEVMWAEGEEIGIGFARPIGEATVKYFMLGTLQHARDEIPVDQFGRGFPPMRPDRGMAD